MKCIAIVGAGMAGLSLAHHLRPFAKITLFEKSRGVSGRMSTRRADPFSFDHGAQYFTVRSEAFHVFLRPLIKNGIIERWNARHLRFDGNRIIEHNNWAEQEPRYVGVPTMDSVAKYLARDMSIHLNTKITAINRLQKWSLQDHNGESYENFDGVILTMPAPQCSELIPENFHEISRLMSIQMRACFSLMLGFSKDLQLDFDAAHVVNSDVSWLAVNSNKPGRPKPYALVVHSSEEFAEKNFESDSQLIERQMMSALSHVIKRPTDSAVHRGLHRWRFANNARHEHVEGFFDEELHLALCGDWILGGRVEGAFTAAFNLAQRWRKFLQ